jgi:hypothetical protein
MMRPTFGPVPLVDGTHTLIPPAEPTPTETPSSTPLLSSTLSTPIRRILQREVEIESAMGFCRWNQGVCTINQRNRAKSWNKGLLFLKLSVEGLLS